MENNTNLPKVPEQVVGSEVDVVDERKFEHDEEALKRYLISSERLLDINNWGKYAGISAFQLIDSHGVRAQRLAEQQDYIRIDIPGPGTKAGMGYDWVRIEEIERNDDGNERYILIRVRPCPHPLSDKNDTAHFLKDNATSTFIVRQRGNVVYAEEHGRNELPNTNTGSLYDKGRNFVVGMAAKIGLSYPQWSSLVKGLLAD
ncbi:hypothetical protein [Pedobacter jejuensis]|uniref:Uncharacterized protein n=1 Tax=Pedobacter jejuensis TaxID=1268550 RepID=A0A3N0BSL8_9SPHI|nr:hypothetical protein [Pedobacter jejuensis]RNL52117.1 hypothetical protein D7004_11040 [Pedobacter jejuensis]